VSVVVRRELNYQVGINYYLSTFSILLTYTRTYTIYTNGLLNNAATTSTD
jgi:hypothetical protein